MYFTTFIAAPDPNLCRLSPWFKPLITPILHPPYCPNYYANSGVKKVSLHMYPRYIPVLFPSYSSLHLQLSFKNHLAIDISSINHGFCCANSLPWLL